MDIRQVTETIAMIEEQNFDIRTITMGISLLDCINPDINRAAEKIYQKITTKAANLVAVGDEIAAELGIPIVNKRVSVTPISLIGAATDATDYVVLAKALDKAAKRNRCGFLSVASLPWYKRGTKREMRFSSILFLVLWPKRTRSARQSISVQPSLVLI